jgi:hypothetical protein
LMIGQLPRYDPIWLKSITGVPSAPSLQACVKTTGPFSAFIEQDAGPGIARQLRQRGSSSCRATAARRRLGRLTVPTLGLLLSLDGEAESWDRRTINGVSKSTVRKATLT